MMKTAARDRAQLVIFAHENGLLNTYAGRSTGRVIGALAEQSNAARRADLVLMQPRHEVACSPRHRLLAHHGNWSQAISVVCTFRPGEMFGVVDVSVARRADHVPVLANS